MTLQLNPSDLLFMFNNVLAGDTPAPGTDPFSFIGIRTIDGTNNNIAGTIGSPNMIVDQHGNIVDSHTFGNLNEAFINLTSTASPLAYAAASSNPMDPGFFVSDTAPRIVSNLIADDTAANPATAGIDMLNPGDPVNDVLPFNSLFTLFGQFFDHGLDFVAKGGNGVVAIPLLPSDPLYDNSPGAVNMMFLSRATRDANGDEINTTAPFIEQSQTYGSHPATSFYLREYDVNGEMTGDLVHGEDGMATWADIKANALQWAEAQAIAQGGPTPTEMLNDTHIGNVPDPTMWYVATASFLSNSGTGQAFLADIAHNANPDSQGGPLSADADSIINPFGFGAPAPASGEYDDELLDAHFIAGDPRANENAGLTAIHTAFHDEHTRIVNQIKDWVDQQDQVEPGFAAQWTGEMYFQAAKLVNEMQYQHMVFEEFGRRMSPNIDAFSAYDVNINPNISAEFAHAVYRLGHSMQTDVVKATDALGQVTDSTLIDAFLNPILFGEHGGADWLKGAQMEQGNQIDEFVVDGLRNFLVGLPLDLAALNIARGRETGIGSLNQTRAELFAQTGDTSLQPYDSWADFGSNLLNPGSLVNFIAAYSHDTDIANARNAGDTTLARSLAETASMDATFMGTGAGSDQGYWDIDLWMGGLAEEKVPLGMLGSTFDFIFAQQMLALQNGDRFYYLARLEGTNILEQIESHTFADIMARSTGATHLNGDAFGFTDVLTELSSLQVDDLIKTPAELLDTVHEIIGGNNNDNIIMGGAGNDSIYGEGGEDDLEGGIGDDHIYGGTGDDVIMGDGGFDFLRGDGGDDEIHGGSDDDAISGGAGNDELFGDQGADALLGNAGDDIIHGGNQDDEIIGGDGNDELHGDNGADEIIGGAGNDVILGGTGDDRITGDDGNDLIIGGAGADRIDGGVGGFDISSFETYNDTFAPGAVNGLTINMLDPALGTGDARDDSFDGIEAVRGTIHGDTMVGDDLDNVLYGLSGNDNISGGIGDDTMFGGEGDDSLFGNAGIDTVVFEGNEADFTRTSVAGGTQFIDTVGNGGTDFVSNNVELWSFDDGLFDSTSGQYVPLIGLSAAQTQTRMQNGTEVTGELEAIADVDDATALSGQGVFIADIEITDPDGGGVPTVALAGDDAAAFTIVNIGGVRKLHLTGGGATSQTNFEIKPFYHVAVTVTDATGSSAVNLTVNVADVDDNSPVITSGNRVNVQENTAVHEVLYRPASEDLDTNEEDITYTLSGDDASHFSITNGEIRFNSSPNYEEQSDADGNNIFELTISADDGTNAITTKDIKIHVKDVLDSINGTPGVDDLEGFAGDDVIYAFEDDDDIEGMGGNDLIFGGDGNDTAHYSGSTSDYTFTIIDTDGTLQVTDNRSGSPDGTDILHDVEFFEFDGNPGLTFAAAGLFTNAPVVADTPVDLGAIDEDAAGFIVSSTELVNGAFDINGDPLTVANVSVPAGQGTITFLNSSMGVDFYNYVPAADDDTDVVISFDVTDGANFTPYSATLDLTPIDDAPGAGAPVTLAPTDEDTARVITTAELVANIIEVDGDTLTASNVAIASGAGSLADNMDGTWTYTPVADDDTDVSFSFDVSDGTSSVATSATLDITPVNDAPIAAAVTLTASDEDTVRTITAAELLAGVSDVDGPAAAISSVSIATGGGSLVDNMNGTWDYTPDANDDTAVTFDYTATDGSLTASSTASLDLLPVNDAPTAAPVVLTAIAEDSGARLITSAELLAGVSDVDGPAATITSVTIAAGAGSLSDNTDGTWTYTPAADDDTAVSFDYTASDGTLSASSTASLDITPVNDAPVAAAVTLTASDEDTVRTITTAELLAGVSDVDGPAATISSVSIATGGGSLLDNMNGTWDYTPDANDDTAVTFDYTATDGSLTASSTASLDLLPVNDAPTAAPVVLTAIAEDSGARLITSAELLAGVSDVDGPAATITAVSIASGAGSLSDNTDGTWTYTPAANDDTDVSFDYTASDGTLTASSTASLDITPVNDAPTASPVTLAAMAEDTTRIITAAELLAGVSDVDGPAAAITSISIASGGGSVLDNMDGTWTYTPDANDDTDVTFDYTASDGTLTATSTATMDITPENDAPVNSGSVSVTAVENEGTITVDLLGSTTDPDGDTMIVAGLTNTGGDSSGVMVNGNNLEVDTSAYASLTAGQSEVITYSYQVLDLNGGSVTQTASITINGASIIMGDEFNNNLVGTAFDDVIQGLGANDILTGNEGADDLDGGTGIDWAYYNGSSSAVNVDLAAGTGTGGDAEGDTLVNIEKVLGSLHDDTITGGAGAEFLRGNAGADTLNGGGGNDILRGDQGADALNGGSGIDWAYYDTASAGVTVDLQAGVGSGNHAAGDTYVNIERVLGSAHNDVITGNAVTNYLSGLAGDDVINGGGGNDVLLGGAGADAYDGGTGNDWVFYTTSDSAVTVDLGANTGSGGHATGDTFASIERILGSNFDDTIIGDADGNYLAGNGGDDMLLGAAGNDILRGDEGADVHDGQGGTDWVSYVNSDLAVTVDLGANTGSGGDATGDTFISIERVIGSNHGDTITGTTGNNYLRGRAGDDVMNGGDGNDTLRGDTGADTLTGGAGSDMFLFFASNGADTITDFEDGTDSIKFMGTGLAYGDLTITDDGTDATVDYGSGTVLVQNTTASLLTTDDFDFV